MSTTRTASRSLRLGVALGVTLTLLGSGGSVTASTSVVFRTTISAPVDINPECRDQASESLPQLGRVPGTADDLRVVYLQDGGDGVIGGASADGGSSWTLEPVTSAVGCTGGPDERGWSANPFLSVGAGGATYYGNSWVALDGSAQGVLAHRWSDPSSTWSAGSSPDPTDRSAQNANVAASPTDPNALAMLWTHAEFARTPLRNVPVGADLRFARSVDGGTTFTTPKVLVSPPAGFFAVNSVLVRLAGDELVAIYSVADAADLVATAEPTETTQPPLETFSIRTTDDGETWSTPVRIGEQYFVQGHDPDDDALTAANRGGTTYASVKTDLVAGPGGMVAAAWAQPHQAGRSTIDVVVSLDAGRTWSSSQVIVPTQAIEPAVAFTDDGALGLFWYDFRNDVSGDGSLSVDAWLAVSPDRGSSWEQIHVDGPFDLTRTNACTYGTPVPTPFSQSCPLLVDKTELGVYQDVVGLPDGFGVAYTVGPPLVEDGFTDVRFAKVLTAP